MAVSGLRWDSEIDGVTLLPMRLLTPLDWRPIDGGERIELYIPRREVWKDLDKRFLPLLEGLQAGDLQPALRARLAAAYPDMQPNVVDFYMIRFLAYLKHSDMLEVLIPEPLPSLGERFPVVKELGRGGMGVVWLCRDLSQEGHPFVAVKHAWNWRGRFSAREDGLRAEAAIMKELDHPRIVKVIDEFQFDGRFHLARDYVEGSSLNSLFKRSRGLDADLRHRYLRQMVGMLAYIRDAGYMYADFKTANFYIAPDGDLTLVDLGLCRKIEPGTRYAKGLLGTDTYAPPETFGKKEVTEPALVFAVGRAIGQMVTAHTPRSTSTPEKHHTRTTEEVATMRAKGADEATIALYLDCCALDPAKRPQTFEELLDRIP